MHRLCTGFGSMNLVSIPVAYRRLTLSHKWLRKKKYKGLISRYQKYSLLLCIMLCQIINVIFI